MGHDTPRCGALHLLRQQTRNLVGQIPDTVTETGVIVEGQHRDPGAVVGSRVIMYLGTTVAETHDRGGRINGTLERFELLADRSCPWRLQRCTSGPRDEQTGGDDEK